MSSISDTADEFVSAHAGVAAALPGAGDRNVERMRADALARFREIGFPGPRDEDWKYTSAAAMLKEPFAPVPLADFEPDLPKVEAAVSALGARDDSPIAVFVNGRFAREVSRGLGAGAGAGVGRTADAFGRKESDGPHPLTGAATRPVGGFAALNAAYAADGAAVTIARREGADVPIHVVYFATAGERPLLVQPRSLIVVEDGAHGTVIEHFAGEGVQRTLTNAVTDVYLGAGASLDHVRVQNESEDAFHVARIDVRQDRSSRYGSHAVAFGASASRTEISVLLAAEGAECELSGLYAIDGDRHADHHTVVDHAAPRTTSREVYKGVLDDRARGVFTGRVLVRPDSQQIVAEQSNRNLLLSEGAVADTRPQLEIYADDVKCSHGATVGRLDEEAWFYLRQRGLGAAEARALLTYAFASEVVNSIGAAEVREALARELHVRLGQPGEGGRAQ